MHPEKVVFAFFIVFAFTINFAFFVGEISDPDHHHVYELFAAIVVNLVATVLKFGERSQIGAVLLATSLVADLQRALAGGRIDTPRPTRTATPSASSPTHTRTCRRRWC